MCILVLTLLFGYVAAGQVSNSAKIVNGTEADIIKFDYQVAMLFNGGWTCGGSIISRSWVLSAAHCVFGKNFSLFSFRAGSNYSESGGQVVNAVQIIVHPKYDNNTENYDAILARVSPSFNIGTPGINPIRVGMIEPKGGTAVVVSGWGDIQTNGTSSPVLLSVELSIVDRSSCANSWMSLKNMQITNVMICAGAPFKDSCQGDSGGPLVLRDKKLLVGIVSYGDVCAHPNLPGVYTDVSDIRMWIYRVAKV